MSRWTHVAAVTSALALAASGAARAQEPAEPPDSLRAGAGFRLTYGATLAVPYLDEEAHAPFAELGDFRPGLGIQVGAGYRVGDLELMGTVDFAGLDVGEPFERDGIPMGRRTSILRAFGLTLWWEPPRLEISGWRGRFGVGYVGGSVDNASVPPDSLPAELEEFARTVEPVRETQPVGVGGRGLRLGVGAERDFGRTLAARLQLDAELMRYRSFIVRQDHFEWEGGRGWVPRLAALLRWAP